MVLRPCSETLTTRSNARSASSTRDTAMPFSACPTCCTTSPGVRPNIAAAARSTRISTPGPSTIGSACKSTMPGVPLTAASTSCCFCCSTARSVP